MRIRCSGDSLASCTLTRMQEPFSPPAEFLQVIADAQATADFLLYGALAVAVFLAVLLPRRHPSHKRKIYLASVLLVAALLLSLRVGRVPKAAAAGA